MHRRGFCPCHGLTNQERCAARIHPWLSTKNRGDRIMLSDRVVTDSPALSTARRR
jgi:hypothetical protein